VVTGGTLEHARASAWFTHAAVRHAGAEDYLAAGVQHMAATGIIASEQGATAAGAVLRAAGHRMSPAAWDALRRGPKAYREFLTTGQGIAAA